MNTYEPAQNSDVSRDTNTQFPYSLRLNRENAFQFDSDLRIASDLGLKPGIIIENVRGLSADYVRQLLEDHPQALISASSFFVLAEKLREPKTKSRPNVITAATLALALVSLLALFVERLFAA